MAKAELRRRVRSVEEPKETAVVGGKIIGRGLRANRRLPLRALREAIGMTQIEVATSAEMNQGDVSRLEQRDDIKLSTLRRYADALGAKVELTAVLQNGRRIVLDI